MVGYAAGHAAGDPMRLPLAWDTKMTLFILTSVVVGGALGFGYSRLVGCSSGACPITSKPYSSTLNGALLGYLNTPFLLFTGALYSFPRYHGAPHIGWSLRPSRRSASTKKVARATT